MLLFVNYYGRKQNLKFADSQIMLTTLTLALLAAITAALQDIPSITLKNAAVSGTKYPMIGLGTGSYCGNGRSNISNPECWTIESSSQATINWYNLGGRRFDNANTYPAWQGVAVGLLNISNNWTTIKREDVFITSKTGRHIKIIYMYIHAKTF